MTTILNLFKFIESKKKQYPIPLKYKLINNLPLTKDELNVRGSLNLSHAPIQSLPDNLNVDGDLIISNTKIKSLPDNLNVNGNLNLNHTLIKELPDNLNVPGWLAISNTKIETIPNNLNIGQYLYISNTPLSKKYTKEQIIKMIKDKGGSLNSGQVFM